MSDRDVQIFERLLGEPESDLVDFKRELTVSHKEPDGARKRAEFVKDLIAFRNTPRTTAAYIVYGVHSNPDASKVLHPLTSIPDGASLQDKVNAKWCDPVPRFAFRPLVYKGQSFAFIEIPPIRTGGPTQCKRTVGSVLKEGDYYYRRDSQNATADWHVLHDILNWFQTGQLPVSHATPPKPAELLHFVSLRAAMRRGGMAFPKAHLFAGDLTFFLPEVTVMLRNLVSILASQAGERLALITGDPGSGKTVTALTVGLQMMERGATAFYWKMNAKTTFDLIWRDIQAADRENTVLILDDVHLNYAIASQIYYLFEEKVQHASCLLVSRNVQKEERVNYEDDCLDAQEMLASDERAFDVSSLSASRMEEKMLGIVERHRHVWQTERSTTLTIGDGEGASALWTTVVRAIAGRMIRQPTDWRPACIVPEARSAEGYSTGMQEPRALVPMLVGTRASS